jgi:hypothetical protein
MVQLISLSVTRRKSANKNKVVSPAETYGFDVEDIVVPIRDAGGYRYFTARQLKGTNPSSKLVGGTDYEVSDTIAQIAAKSKFLVPLTVTKRRGNDVNNEDYIFVTSRFSENIKVSDSGGSKFFYQEDGDVNLVEYEVAETIAQIIALITPVDANTGHVIQDEGINLTQQPILNFVGTGVTVTNGPGAKTTVTITSSAIISATVDMDTAFALGVLTIPPADQEADVFNLINGVNGSVITEIVGNSTAVRKVQRFAPEVGASFDFDHALVAVATSNKLISDAGAVNTINGDEGAFIEFERVTISGARSVNRRYNAVVPA